MHGSTLACPRCGAHMVETKKFGVVLDACPSCKRLWLDDGDFQRAFKRDPPPLGRPASLDLEESPHACPRCGLGLTERTLADEATQRLDACARCRGVLVDESVLARLKSLSAMARPAPERAMPRSYREPANLPPIAPERGGFIQEIGGADGWLSYLFFLPVVENRGSSIPVGTFLVAIVLVLAWLAQIGGIGLERSIDLYAFVPSEVASGRRVPGIVTGMFLHGGWFHAFGNVYFLVLFGGNVERRFGTAGFLALYFAGGLLAFLLTLVVSLSSDIPVVGASGAIAAVMGAYLLVSPGTRILQPFFRFFLRVWAVALPAWLYMGIWFALNAWGAWEGAPGVAWSAHIGGFVSGAIAGVVVRARSPEG